MKLVLQSIPSTIITEIIANSQFDGVVLDTEHGVYNDYDLFNCIQVMKLSKKKCFVRVTHLDKKLVRLCLDSGVDGIIFSTIENKSQSESIIEYCNYPSFGGKRGQGIVRENNWGEIPLGKTSPLIIAQIETKMGVDNIEEIKNCGFNYFVLGPYDLSASLGCVAEWNNPKYLEYANKLYNHLKKEELGIFLPKEKDLLDCNFKSKFSFFIIGIDTIMIIDSLKRLHHINEKN